MLSDVVLFAALGFVLVRPGGAARSYWDDWRESQRTRHLIKLHWTQLTSSPSRIDGGVGDPRSDAPVIIEFADFECPACKQAVDTVEQFTRRHPEVAIIIRQYPLRAIHPAAETAAKASLCAGAQGRFREAYMQFYRRIDWQSAVDWARVAKDLGIENAEAFRRCVGEPRSDQVDADYKVGQALGVRGTPTFISRGGLHGGLITVRELERLAGI